MLINLFFRGWLIVTLTALNIVMLSRSQYFGAFLTSTALSAVWWVNAKHAAYTPGFWPGACYAFGAGTGCVTGLMIGALLK